MSGLIRKFKSKTKKFNKHYLNKSHNSCYSISAILNNQNEIIDWCYAFSSLADIHNINTISVNVEVDDTVKTVIPIDNEIARGFDNYIQLNYTKQKDHFTEQLKLYEAIANLKSLENMKWIRTDNEQKYFSRQNFLNDTNVKSLQSIAEDYNAVNKLAEYDPIQRMYSCSERKIASAYYDQDNQQIDRNLNNTTLVIFSCRKMCSICYDQLIHYINTSREGLDIKILDIGRSIKEVNEINSVCNEKLASQRDKFDEILINEV